jgi:hypothetical protein
VAAANGVEGKGGHTTMWRHQEGRRRGIVRPFTGQAWQLACTSCGYLEWWITDQDTIRFIEENWVKVPPSG